MRGGTIERSGLARVVVAVAALFCTTVTVASFEPNGDLPWNAATSYGQDQPQRLRREVARTRQWGRRSAEGDDVGDDGKGGGDDQGNGPSSDETDGDDMTAPTASPQPSDPGVGASVASPPPQSKDEASEQDGTELKDQISIFCPEIAYNTFFQVPYSYTVETMAGYEIQAVLKEMEAAVLDLLGTSLLPCQDRRRHLKSSPDLYSVVGIDSNPEDTPNEDGPPCEPQYEKTNSCTVVTGTLTLFLHNYDLINMARERSQWLISDAMSSGDFLPFVSGLVRAIYRGPEVSLTSSSPTQPTSSSSSSNDGGRSPTGNVSAMANAGGAAAATAAPSGGTSKPIIGTKGAILLMVFSFAMLGVAALLFLQRSRMLVKAARGNHISVNTGNNKEQAPQFQFSAALDGYSASLNLDGMHGTWDGSSTTSTDASVQSESDKSVLPPAAAFALANQMHQQQRRGSGQGKRPNGKRRKKKKASAAVMAVRKYNEKLQKGQLVVGRDQFGSASQQVDFAISSALSAAAHGQGLSVILETPEESLNGSDEEEEDDEEEEEIDYERREDQQARLWGSSHGVAPSVTSQSDLRSDVSSFGTMSANGSIRSSYYETDYEEVTIADSSMLI